MEDFLVYVLTYNVGTKFPASDEDFKQLLGLESGNRSSSEYINVPDLYVIGLQEVKAQPQNIVWDTLFDDPWTAKVRDMLSPLGLVKIHTLRMQGIVTSLFLKRSHLTFLRDVETLWTRRGFGGMWGNKGAVSIRLGIHGCSICLVNCHLTPHDQFCQERVDDYRNILTGQTFSQQETSNILYHDYVFWFGDLNFRLDGTHSSTEIAEMISQEKSQDLMKHDQLLKVRRTGDAFSELSEMAIAFPPTYKFESGVDSYDTKRRPGWVDRVLYHVNTNAYDNVTLKINGLTYKSHMNYRSSDHRPVTAMFQIKVFRPTIEKLVEFHKVSTWYTNEENKVFFKINPTLETSHDDWIALFKADFSSLDEYVAYVYSPKNNVHDYCEDSNDRSASPSSSNRPGEYSVIFPETSVNFDGSYVILYFSHASRSIYGMSNTFESVTRAVEYPC
ncbi:unnamed protein product [Orchesella dallaii]|uniref:Inositol polyphosphate-related phosphatase domain-containing protein n=1 Tax=Orchesella dallaii TaxID=48710 RepID=A0ABP1PRI0_9HEXA